MRENIVNNFKNFFIAEIGTNHNQKKSIVKKMIKEIAKSGCQCVKYQIYEPDEIVNKKIMVSDYNLQKFYGNISAHLMFDKYLKTPKKWFPDLINFASRYNLKTAVTIHGENGLSWAVKNKADFIKIASMDHNNFPFLKKAVKVLKVPILVSLGMAKLEDISILIKILSEYKYGYGVFHCVSLYPPKSNELRLENILFLKKKYKIPVGFSDHSENYKAATVAKKYGASFFEKHITLNKKMIGPDHAFAINIKKLKKYVTKITKTNFIEDIKVKFKKLSNREKIIRKKYLKGLIASKNLKKNTTIKSHHIKICRPLGSGYEPKYFDKILGKKIRHSINQDDNFKKSHFYR